MKPIIYAVLALGLALPAAAQLYKWVDKDGKTHYSDTPPLNVDTKKLNVQSGATSESGKSAVERDKAGEKARTEAREAGKKGDEAAKNAAAQEEACSRARSAYQTYADGGRIHRYNEKGEREFMTDEQIEAAKERSRREMDDVCKKS